MRRFRGTHLEAELIPETLMKLWLGYGKKGVTGSPTSRSWAVLRCVENMLKVSGLGSVMSPMSPRVHLKTQLNYHKMAMFPRSSRV